jgi:membrane fusion protein (multidrug efflux system)
MKVVGYLIGLAMAVAVGFFARGLMSGGGPPPGMAPMGGMPPAAVVAQALKEAPLDVQEEYIASVEPVQEVMVRTEVAGYIDQVHFQEGAAVSAGDLLFTIDQKPYRARVAVRQAELSRAKAELVRAEKYLKRLQEAGERSVSEADVDKAESDHLQAVANIEQAEANLNLAQIDLGYTEIRAPIAGRIGAAKATKGNYVTSASDALARIVQTDPIRVVFSMTDRVYLDLRRQEQEGAVEALAARVRLPNGTTLETVGQKDFDDNAMSRETGTLAVRYLFDNPDGLLVSGGYVNILLGQRERPMGIRVPQRAVLVDPQGSYVLTVDDAGQVGTARVQLGKTIEADFVVLAGLKAGDRVVVDGVQKVQPGMTASVTLQEVAP